MTTTSPDWANEIARRLLPCTCGDTLPERMRERGAHYSNCQAENIGDVADALREAYERGATEMRERAALLLDQESDTRKDRSERPYAGDESIGPFSQSKVQMALAINSGNSARRVRSLPTQEPVER